MITVVHETNCEIRQNRSQSVLELSPWPSLATLDTSVAVGGISEKCLRCDEKVWD